MLNENEVVDLLCNYLEKQKYIIISRCKTVEKGIDIIAKKPNGLGRLLIEVKGAKSSIESSKNYGKKGFSSNQSLVRVAKAIYTACCLLSEKCEKDDTVAVAFPDMPKFRKLMARIEPVTKLLQINVYFVSTDGTVA